MADRKRPTYLVWRARYEKKDGRSYYVKDGALWSRKAKAPKGSRGTKERDFPQRTKQEPGWLYYPKEVDGKLDVYRTKPGRSSSTAKGSSGSTKGSRTSSISSKPRATQKPPTKAKKATTSSAKKKPSGKSSAGSKSKPRPGPKKQTAKPKKRSESKPGKRGFLRLFLKL